MRSLLAAAAFLALCVSVTGAMAEETVVQLTLEERVTIIEAQWANPFQKTAAHTLIDRVEALENRLDEVAHAFTIFGARDMFVVDQNLQGLIYDLRELGIPVKERNR